MYEYRVTKFDPDSRDPDGIFRGDDWIGIGDIGDTFQGNVLTESDYVEIESKYVAAVRALMRLNSVAAMNVDDLQIYSLTDISVGLDGFDAMLQTIEKNRLITSESLDTLVRSCLRGLIWCRLVSADNAGVFVHFGYDFYMYFGSLVEIKSGDVPSGIYVEPFSSPYHEDEDEDEGEGEGYSV